MLDWVSDIRVPDDEANRAAMAGLALFPKIAQRDDLLRRVEEAMEQWASSSIPQIKNNLMRMAERDGIALQAIEAEIALLQVIEQSSKRSVLDERCASVSRARSDLTALEGEALFEARARLAAALRQVIDHIEFDASNRFVVFLHGNTKAYRFVDGKFSHAADVEGSTWMRFPTSAQKKRLNFLHAS